MTDQFSTREKEVVDLLLLAKSNKQIANLHPGQDFTCGPAGYFHTHLILPSNLSSSQADKIIMDALEQAVHGPWTRTE